jgi:hypothetical protein
MPHTEPTADELRRSARAFRQALTDRENARCERALPGGRCPLTATQDVDGDKLCDEHAAED